MSVPAKAAFTQASIGPSARSTRAAAHRREQRFANQQHATNDLLQTMRKRGEDSKAKGRSIQGITRDKRFPTTTVASWYYDVFLGLGDAAFQTVIPPVSR